MIPKPPLSVLFLFALCLLPFTLGLASNDLVSQSKLVLRDTIPSSPPWVGSFPNPPACVPTSSTDDCPWDQALVDFCSATQCTATLAGGCMIYAKVVDAGCVCANLTQNRCQRTCTLWWQRASVLTWMNQTCTQLGNWTGLASDWKYQLNVLVSDLAPSAWGVKRQNSSSVAAGDSILTCPSSTAKLGLFAAVNVAMAILVPILGRRTIVHRATFGRLGRPHSRGWLLTGPVTIFLHLLSNTLNALMIKNTAGYSNVSIWRLVLLWCTRPRYVKCSSIPCLL
jgi:hypothetical protein